MSAADFSLAVFMLICALAGFVAGAAWWANARLDDKEDRERKQ